MAQPTLLIWMLRCEPQPAASTGFWNRSSQSAKAFTPAQTSLVSAYLHLGEMLDNSPGLRVQLDGPAIPAYHGALDLLERGIFSTLAPSNRTAWRWLDGPVWLASPLRCPAGVASRSSDLRPPCCWPAITRPQRGSLAKANGFRLALQRTAWVRSVACGSQRYPACSAWLRSGELRAMSDGDPLLANHNSWA